MSDTYFLFPNVTGSKTQSILNLNHNFVKLVVNPDDYDKALIGESSMHLPNIDILNAEMCNHLLNENLSYSSFPLLPSPLPEIIFDLNQLSQCFEHQSSFLLNKNISVIIENTCKNYLVHIRFINGKT